MANKINKELETKMKKLSSNIKPDVSNSIKLDESVERVKEITDIAEDMLQTGDYEGKNVPEFIANTTQAINSSNAALSRRAMEKAGSFTKELLLLVLKQDLAKQTETEYMN